MQLSISEVIQQEREMEKRLETKEEMKKRIFKDVTEMISRFMMEDIHTRTGMEMIHEVEEIFEERKEEIWTKSFSDMTEEEFDKVNSNRTEGI